MPPTLPRIPGPRRPREWVWAVVGALLAMLLGSLLGLGPKVSFSINEEQGFGTYAHHPGDYTPELFTSPESGSSSLHNLSNGTPLVVRELRILEPDRHWFRVEVLAGPYKGAEGWLQSWMVYNPNAPTEQ